MPTHGLSTRRMLRIVLPRLHTVLPLLTRLRRNVLAVRSALLPPKSVPARYCTLEALAVDPACQGYGVGSRLLEAVAGLCDKEESASGVYLATGAERTRALYERHGYRTVESRKFGRGYVYHMFRARGQGQNPEL